MNQGLLESSLRDALNGGIFIFLVFKDEKLSAFYCLEIFNDCSSNIEAKNMKIPPFDTSCHDGSNKP